MKCHYVYILISQRMSFPLYMSFPRKRESIPYLQEEQSSMLFPPCIAFPLIMSFPLYMSFPRKRESIPYLQEEQSSMLFPPCIAFPLIMSFQPFMSFPRKRESSVLWKVIIFTLWQVEEMVHFILVLQMI